jgi:hypothetical protein
VPDVRSGANPERDLLRRQLGARIAGALEKLTPRGAPVFELKHYHGLKLRIVVRFCRRRKRPPRIPSSAPRRLRGALGVGRNDRAEAADCPSASPGQAEAAVPTREFISPRGWNYEVRMGKREYRARGLWRVGR